ncbi:MAG: AAA family ATPase [Bacteroidia bacterium]|nr:AAA family ATPase [Bacteroidia bacterium]
MKKYKKAHLLLACLLFAGTQTIVSNDEWSFDSINKTELAVVAGGGLLMAALYGYVAATIQKWISNPGVLETTVMGSNYNSSDNVTLKDYYGAVPQEVVDFIKQFKDSKKYTKMGIKLPSGMIFFGKPGSGKTHLARAIAGELDCPFFAVNGTDFFHTFQGQSKDSVVNLFAQARNAAKKHTSKTAIVFIDEFDAVGSREGLATGSTFSVEITNTLLSQMDGFVSDQDISIVVIAATNLLHKIDPALIRSGRFDYKVYVDYPDKAGRKLFVDKLLKKYPSDVAVSSDWLAASTEGMSPADLVLLFEVAGRIAVRLGKEVRDTVCFQQALGQIKIVSIA